MDIIRRCPACDKKTLRESLTRRSRVPIDRCTVCAGIWLDGKELERILKGLAVKNLDVPLDAKYSLRYCPNCKEQMHKFLYPQTYAEIDMCEKCKGIWLDVSEYKEIMVVPREPTRESHTSQSSAIIMLPETKRSR